MGASLLALAKSIYYAAAIKPRTQKKKLLSGPTEKVNLNFIDRNYLGLSEEVLILLFSVTANLWFSGLARLRILNIQKDSLMYKMKIHYYTFKFRRCTAASFDSVIIAAFYHTGSLCVGINIAVEHVQWSVCAICFIRSFQVNYL